MHHAQALAALHLHEPRTHETIGTLAGLGLQGEFHEWQDGDKQRRDERLGIRSERILRVGKTMWVQNASGEIRELHGLVARRQITEDFIDSENFARESRYVRFVDDSTLPDGRAVYRLEVAPPSGETYTIAIDTTTWMIDQKSYVDHDSAETTTYADYRVVDGMLIPYDEIDSTGDAKFDVTSHVTNVMVNEPIAADVFAPLHAPSIGLDAPVTVPVQLVDGLPFVSVDVGGHAYRFLLDSGSQGNVVDVSVARALGLHPQGALEIRGATRTSSLGVVDLPDVRIGGATLPASVASVLDMHAILARARGIDGVLGYPFFASAELRFDPDRETVTIAKPGALASQGERLEVDTDRELAEIQATIDGNADTRLVVDTGNSQELLLFQSFIDGHKGLIEIAGNAMVTNRGAGGSVSAVDTMVPELDLGTFKLYNRHANVILSSAGAFADRNDGGNVGFGVLRNFVATFDLANHALYLSAAHRFDDGRYRPRYDRVTPP